MKDEDLEDKFFSGSEEEPLPDETVPDPIEVEEPEIGEPDVADEPQPVEPTQPEAKAEPVPVEVPLDALKDERKKRQELERKIAELEAKASPTPPVERPKLPDPFLEPEAYQAEVQWQNTLQTSALIAVDKHGQEDVNKAIQWFVEKQTSDPVLAQSIRRQVHPVDYAIKEYRRAQLNEGAPTDADPLALARFYAQKAGITLPETPAAPQPVSSVTRIAQPRQLPPRSIVDAPSSPTPLVKVDPKAEAMDAKLFGKAD